MNKKTINSISTSRSTGKKMRMAKIAVLTTLFFSVSLISLAQNHELFSLGSDTNSGEGFALYPANYEDFLANDFGYEDRMFWIGRDDVKTDLPYVLPGPKNGWGGTGPTAGIRSHFLNLGFMLEAAEGAAGSLKIDLADTDSEHAAHLKVLVNGADFQFKLEKGAGMALVGDKGTSSTEQVVQIPLAKGILQNGLNKITISILDGGWIAFDHISLTTTPAAEIKDIQEAVIGEVKSANYQLEESGSAVQPLLVEVFQLDNEPLLSVKLDGKEILTEKLEQGKYLLEAGMPAVKQSTTSQFEVLLDGKVVKKGTVTRSPQPVQQLSGYVNTLLGTAHSRWMIAPGPWMPFGMVKLSPDNQNSGWQAGYDPNFESIGTFSHIHEWTMTGLGTFPTIGETIQTTVGDQSDINSGYRSTIDKSTEYAGIGLYKVHLTDTDIWASLTATDRASFQKYEFKKGDKGRIMIDLSIPTEYGYEIESCEITQVSPTRIEGKSHQLTPNAWSKGVGQDYVVHFVIEFDQPIAEFAHWVDGQVVKGENLAAIDPKSAGAFVEFDLTTSNTVQMRTGISYVSIENAAMNLDTEISKPFGWKFDAVVANQQNIWDELLGRVQVTSNDAREKERFYTNMYRALASRNTFSDVDGKWRDADENIQQFEDPNDFAFLFNYAEKPWLTQKWSRAILDRYYGYDVTNAYLGDEDQGQMSAWFVMASMGLFQVDGGTRSEPIYEIGSPLYEKVEIKLDNRFGRGEKFTIQAKNASRKNKYVQSAILNGKPLNQFWFEAKELLKGGTLVLEMGPDPNENWGVDKLPY